MFGLLCFHMLICSFICCNWGTHFTRYHHHLKNYFNYMFELIVLSFVEII